MNEIKAIIWKDNTITTAEGTFKASKKVLNELKKIDKQISEYNCLCQWVMDDMISKRNELINQIVTN